MNEHFYNGFIKRANSYGVSCHQAEYLFKHADLLEDLSGYLGRGAGMARSGIENLTGADSAVSQLASDHPVGLGIGLAGLGGAGIGAGLGALNGSKDENGKTNRMGHALKGGLIGGLGGTGLGAGAMQYDAGSDGLPMSYIHGLRKGYFNHPY